MEPDHSANISNFAKKYPNTTIVGNQKIFVMLGEYFGTDYADRRLVVEDGATLDLGKHKLQFVFAPMVHWPEVMFTYDKTSCTLFSADAFGKFGARDCDEPWIDEARRYYYGVVGKYGKQVVAVINKIATLDIKNICALHGPVLTSNLGYYVDLYKTWASYTPEVDGVMIAYTSVYGHTQEAVYLLKDRLLKAGVKDVIVCDLIRDDRSACVANAFKYSKLVLATTTYNAEVFPAMNDFISALTCRNYQNRVIGLMENGTWAPAAARLMQARFEKSSGITFAENTVKIRSSLNVESIAQIDALAEELSK
jgi:flavorubredoxin